MRNSMIVALAIAAVGASVAVASPGGIGLGIMAGEPTGLSAKVYLGSHFAIDAAAAYSYLWHGSGAQVHADLLFHTGSLLPKLIGFLPLYVGAGARIRLANGVDNPMRVGVRIPVGAEYVFPIIPLGVFFEVAPILDVAPITGFTGNSALGVRYYFGSHLI